MPEIEPKKTQKLEAKSFYEKSKNEEKLRKDFEKDFIEDSFWTTTDSPKAEKPKAMEPSTSSDGAKPRIAHSTVGNVSEIKNYSKKSFVEIVKKNQFCTTKNTKIDLFLR